MISGFEVRKSAVEGKGVFATALIKKGQMICQFRGTRRSIQEIKDLYKTGDERIDDPLQIEPQVYIDLDEPYIYFNHSCSPNAGMRGSGELFALRDTAPGEEIMFDYSTTEWTDDEAWGINWTDNWRIPCHCSSSDCRKQIGGFPSLSEEQKRWYFEHGALMSFIADRYSGM